VLKRSSNERLRQLNRKKESFNQVSLTRRASYSLISEMRLMCQARLLRTTRLWRALPMCHHSISQRRQSGLSRLRHSTRLIKPQEARSLFNSKHKTGLKAALLISTTTRQTISLSKSSNQSGLSTKTENCRRNDGMKRQSKF
jgi:hypothetical protein